MSEYKDVWNPLLKAWDLPYNASHQHTHAQRARAMFLHGYRSYMRQGFPSDNIQPISCTPGNSQGGIAITLLDSLDTLLTFSLNEDFKTSVQLIESSVHFNASARVHVFETTIRALGGLLAAHSAVIRSPQILPEYGGALLTKARELADRLLPAFATPTGIPSSWVNLEHGHIAGEVPETCTACATTLAVEFRLLSHLTGISVYQEVADRAVFAVYSHRDLHTGLVGNTISTATGEWQRDDASIGPGIDSYYEYLLKTYLIFGDERYLAMFAEQYVSAQSHMSAPGSWMGHNWMLHVHKSSLHAIKAWVSSVSAFWPGFQASVGQIREAHLLFGDFLSAFMHYGWIPEEISCSLSYVHPVEVAYPLRPELIESAFVLWAATGEPRYLRAGEGILSTIELYNSAPCGFASVENVTTGTPLHNYHFSRVAITSYRGMPGCTPVVQFSTLLTKLSILKLG